MSTEDIARFRAFGWTVLGGAIASAHVERLRAAFDCVMASEPTSEASLAESRVLSFGEDAHPSIAELVALEPLISAMRALFERAPLYLGSFLMQTTGEVPWHTNGMPGVAAEPVRATIYLDASSADQGALHVLPGSHCLEWSRVLFQSLGYWEGRGARLSGDPHSHPGAVAIPTNPGDVLVWHTDLWHASFPRADGRSRRGIYLSYLPDPGADPIAAERLRKIASSARSTRRPYLYGEALARQNNPRIFAMVERLRELGVPNVIAD